MRHTWGAARRIETPYCDECVCGRCGLHKRTFLTTESQTGYQSMYGHPDGKWQRLAPICEEIT